MSSVNKISKTPISNFAKIERYLMKYKKITSYCAKLEYNITSDQFYRSIYILRKQGYPIKSIWTKTATGNRCKIYSIPSKWSKKNLRV